MPIYNIPWDKPAYTPIVPIFLPFAGCPTRCIFCSQETQTSHKAAWQEVRVQMRQIETRLGSEKRIPELAFYGGTFTGLRRDRLDECLEFAVRLKRKGLIQGFRCSTRPDFIRPDLLVLLREAGCHLVELGIQSFSLSALQRCNRGYSAEICLDAARQVKDCALQLGIQLLPGMPGSSSSNFLHDVQMALNCETDVLRFYPCLVLEGTHLAQMWRSGVYRPWSMSRTISLLARGWNMAHAQNVPVIRMGLLPVATLRVLAGPNHPALGSRILGYALYSFVRRLVKSPTAFTLVVPRYCQGHFWGWRNELALKWARLGLEKVSFCGDTGLALKF